MCWFDLKDNDLAVVEYLSSSEEESENDNGMTGNNLEDDNEPRDAPEKRGFEDRMHNLDLLLAKAQNYRDDDVGTFDTDDFTDQGRYPEDKLEAGEQSAPSPLASRSSSREQETAEQEDPDADLATITDPQLRKAIKKMRKLDQILSTKVTREKEVKRQRKLLHYQLEVELDSIKEEGGGKSKDATENTTRFLALVPPVSHDEGKEAFQHIWNIIN